MSRRWTGRRPETAAAELSEALSASSARNLTLCADNETLRRDADDTAVMREADKKQMAFLREELARARADRSAETQRADGVDRRLAAMAADLKREREHTAGSCSHAAELRAMGIQVGALERRVHELQQANMSRDVAEIIGWEPVATLPSGDRKALRRGRG